MRSKNTQRERERLQSRKQYITDLMEDGEVAAAQREILAWLTEENQELLNAANTAPSWGAVIVACALSLVLAMLFVFLAWAKLHGQ